MKIAVASEGLDVANDFLQSTNFNFYATEGFELADSKNIPANGLTCKDYASLLEAAGVDVLVCGHMTAACKQDFEDVGIAVHQGAAGNALQAARSYLANQAQALADDLEDDD